MTPRKTRSNKPPADPNQPPNGRRSDPDPVEPTSSFGKGKNPRKRSPDRDEEPGTAPPLKKRVSNRRPPSSAHPSPAAKRAASRRSTRKISRPSKKDVPEPADPDPDVIIIEEDGCPYVVYDDAPHFHPPPQRYTQSDTGQLSTSPEQVKGCSIKPCWRPTQQRRCRILQADEAVEEIGWKKVRKWMQAVRCRLCGETQVLRDLKKGCFNLEHWWRHLRVRHGIKREEEIEEKGEEKYKALPIKGHVCVGACSACGESGAAASTRQRNPSTRHGRGAKRRDGSAAEFSDLNSLPGVDTMRNPPRESIPQSVASIPGVEPRSPDHAPRAGPSNASDPLPDPGLYTLANARPQYQCEPSGPLTQLTMSGSGDLPPLVPRTWAEYIDLSLYLAPLTPLSSTTTIPSPQRPPIHIAPSVTRSQREAVHTLLSLSAGPPPTIDSSSSSTGAPAPRPAFRLTSASLPTPLPTVASTSHDAIPPSPSGPTTVAAVTATPSFANYRWPPANIVPANAPSPPCMMAASWEESDTEEDEVGEVEVPSTSDRPRNVPTHDTSAMEDGGEDHIMANEVAASTRLVLRHSPVRVWDNHAEDSHEMADGPSASAPAPWPQGEAEGANSSEPLLQPEWAFVKQDESEPDEDEDDDMVDQLLGDS